MPVEFRAFTVTYDGQAAAISDFSLSAGPGARIGLAGESGCGKTTLLRAAAGLLPETARTAGECIVRGKAGYVPQESLASLSPFLTAGEQLDVLTGSRASSEELMIQAGLREKRLLQAYPHQMSGGERQRLLVAQALALTPDMILADEPTAHLDADTEEQVLGALDAYARSSGATLVIASHAARVFRRLGCEVRELRSAEPVVRRPAPAASGRVLLRAENVTKTYFSRDWMLRPRAAKRALNGVSLEIAQGETVALTGPSGSGKSTLARCLAGRDQPDSGSIQWSEDVPAAMPDRVQLVAQEPSESLNPRFTVAQALAEASPDAGGAVLESVRLPAEWLSRRVSELSEGQRARIAILRAALRAPQGLLILDESLNGLDGATRSHILDFLRDRSVLLITHDHEIAAEAGARVVPLT